MAKSKKRVYGQFKKDTFRSQFDILYQVFKKANLNFQHVDQLLPSSSNSDESLFDFQTLLFIFCLATFLIQIVGINELATLIGYLNLNQDKCLIPAKGIAKDIFVPPLDCSVCASLNSVSRVKNITKEEFESKYAYSNVPVVIEAATSDWRALHEFSFSFFRHLYSQHSSNSRCQFFPYQTSFRNLKEALNEVDTFYLNSSQPWYFGWSDCDPVTTAILREFYTKPYFLPENSETSRLNWIFMGTPGYGAPMHIDRVGNPSWQAQIKGTKLWILEPPVECYLSCKTLKIEVNSGDIIVLDTDKWFHQTLVVGNETSITIGSEYD